jgi:hypothetical protein
MQTETLGIIAGGENLPFHLITQLQKNNQPCFVIAINGEANNIPSNVPQAWFDIGQINSIVSTLKGQNITKLTLIGKIKRPSFSMLKLDSCGIKLMSRITKAKFLGDDSTLSIVIKFLEEEGFEVIGSEAILKEQIVSAGVLGQHIPNQLDQQDIRNGLEIAQTIGKLDIGQSIIIERGLVLGVEAAEGTDQLIERCKYLKRYTERSGLLIKLTKPNQDLRIDLPTIGTSTIERLHAANFAGVAISAGSSYIVEPAKTIELADKLGLFIVGVGS